MMQSFSTFFVALLSIVTITTAEWKTYCNYVIEPGYPSSGFYGDVLSAEYQNVTIPARAYSLNYCNWAYDYKLNKRIGYKYECYNNNQEIRVSLYENDVTCGTTPVQHTFTSSQTSFNCDGQSCLLAMSRYNNTDYNTSCRIESSDQLNAYGLVNGACQFATEIGYNLKTKCDPTDASYFRVGYYESSDSDCQSGPGIDSDESRIESGTCPGSATDSNPHNDKVGELGYMVQSCAGNPFQTTMPASTSVPTNCTFVIMEDYIVTDQCVHFDEDEESGIFYCKSGELYWKYWNSSAECTGDMTMDVPYKQAFSDDEVDGFNCVGSSDNCEVAYVHINKYDNSTDYFPSNEEECREKALNEPQKRIPMPLNECLRSQQSRLKLFCDGDHLNMTTYASTDTSCQTIDGYPNFFIENSDTEYECVLSTDCKTPTSNPTMAPTQCENGNIYTVAEDCQPNPCECDENDECSVDPCKQCNADWTNEDHEECGDDASYLVIKAVFIVVMGVSLLI